VCGMGRDSLGIVDSWVTWVSMLMSLVGMEPILSYDAGKNGKINYQRISQFYNHNNALLKYKNIKKYFNFNCITKYNNNRISNIFILDIKLPAYPLRIQSSLTHVVHQYGPQLGLLLEIVH